MVVECCVVAVSRCRRAASPSLTQAGEQAGRGPKAPCPYPLELQAGFAGGFCQGLDAAVVAVARTIEGNLLDAGGLGTLSDDAANLGGGIGVLAVLQAFHDVGLGGVGGSQHLGTVGGEDLGVQVLAGAQHRQAGDAELTDVGAGRLGATQAGDVLVHFDYSLKAEGWAFP
ncbi:hypothetical protein G6F57_016769 [Rhizopus arrhizus]|nr:hypothetical protein G6F57_016769 [Rhizopus arrhizus]